MKMLVVRLLTSAVLVCSLAYLWVGGVALAQEDFSWSTPALVFEGQGTVASPVVLADGYGQIHAFWIFTPDTSTGAASRQIYYARMDRPELSPVDIHVVDNNIVTLDGAANGRLMSVMWGGSTYTVAGPSPELSARGWSPARQLGTNNINSHFAVAPDGAVWVVYGDRGANAVFVRRLNPDTEEWEAPIFVANTRDSKAAPDAPRLSFSSDNVLHVVWAEYQLPAGWPPLGVYYARSTDGGQNWSAPRELEGPGANQPNVLAGNGDQVYITWVGIAGVGGKYFIQSNNKGESWSGATSIFSTEGGGSEGAPSMVLDSLGRLHVLFSNLNCVWYTSLQADGWSDPECISRSIPSSHTEYPIMTVGLGNRLHVMFWTNDRQLWYMTRKLNTPGQGILPTPTQVVYTPVPPTATPTPVLPPTPLPDLGPYLTPEAMSAAGQWSFIGGIVPVVALFLIAYVVRRRR